MMQEINWFGTLPTQCREDLLKIRKNISAQDRQKMLEYSEEYFDGQSAYGYGGYQYDGRFATVVQRWIDHYHITKEAKILELGCAKGYILYEFFKQGITDLHGIDISDYAISNVPREIHDKCRVGSAHDLSMFADNSIDFVYSKDTLHNLTPTRVDQAIAEIARVSKGPGFLQINSYANDNQKMGLETWVITIKTIRSAAEWLAVYKKHNYQGDYHFLTFDYLE